MERKERCVVGFFHTELLVDAEVHFHRYLSSHNEQESDSVVSSTLSRQTLPVPRSTNSHPDP